MQTTRRIFRSGAFLVVAAFAVTGCGGRSINKKTARDVILGTRADAIGERNLQVVSVTQGGASEAIVETELHTAFRLEKVGRDWVVRDVRVGEGPWENMDDLLRAIRQARIDETRRLLEKIAAAIASYRQKNGRLPQFKDYTELSDALSPLYMSPVVRLDPWGSPLTATRTGPDSVVLTSAGPDARLGTADDIQLARDFSR